MTTLSQFTGGRTIASIVNGPISAEVTALDRDGMLKEGRVLAGIHPNIVVKIPMIEDGMKQLGKEEQIKTMDIAELVEKNME